MVKGTDKGQDGRKGVFASTPSLLVSENQEMSETTLERHEESRRHPHVHLSLETETPSAFVELLQNGFLFGCRVGVSIVSFLCEELGLSRPYVAEKISTIFLDGRCVDDIDSAMLKEGSVLALSAAMPGLAGASLRRGGVYSALRSSITYRQSDQRKAENGLCLIKLFNLLTVELGPVFLRRGILVRPEELVTFLDRKNSHFWRKCGRILLDEEPVERKSLLEFLRHSRVDFLRLTANTDKREEHAGHN